MAKTDTAVAKPATKRARPAAKPAVQKPAVRTGVGIKELAADLDRTPKSVRAAIRRLKGGPQVGKGGTYSWKSKSDPAYKALLKALRGKATTETVEQEVA